MIPRETTLQITPDRLALLEAGGPRPVAPPSWTIVTDHRWGEIQDKFRLPDICGGVAIRAYLEWTCMHLAQSRREAMASGQWKSDDRFIKWLSKASNVGKPLASAVEGSVLYRLTTASVLLKKAAQIIVDPATFANAKVLTIPIQLCAKVCLELSGSGRKQASPTLALYVALWRCWERHLGRKATLWAHPNGTASAFVKFVACVLRLSREALDGDDTVAWMNVRQRLAHAREHHPECFETADLTAFKKLQEGAATMDLAAGPDRRLRLRRRTHQSGFSRSRA